MKNPRPPKKACAVCGRFRTKGDSIICSYCLEDFKELGFVPLQVLKLYNEARDVGTVPPSYTFELIDIVNETTGKGKLLLDVGCGEGHFSDVLSKKSYEVVATDFSKKALSEAKRRFRIVDFCLADASRLPFRDETFNTVICLELIEHLFDPKTHLREVRRVLKNKGAYIIKTPNKWISKLYYALKKQDDAIFWHPSHKSYFELKKLLQEFGFRVNFKKLRQLPPSHLEKMKNLFNLYAKPLERLPINLIPPILQPSLTFVATKPATNSNNCEKSYRKEQKSL